MKLKALLTTLLAALLLASCADPITELKSGLTDDALSRLGATVGVNWTNRANTNIYQSIDGNTDSKGIANPVVIKEGNTYKMWYSGLGVDDKWRVIYATSEDGKSWSKPANNPVLIPTNTNENALDRDGVKVVSVIYDPLEKRYKMWYIGYVREETEVTNPGPPPTTEIVVSYQQRLFFARSDDGINNWVRYPNDRPDQLTPPSPVLEITNATKELLNIDNAAVLQEIHFDGFKYYTEYSLWYSYESSPNLYTLMSAESTTGTNWKKRDFASLSNKAFYRDRITSPVVIRDYYGSANAYKLWFTGVKGTEYKIGYAISETDGVFFNYYDSGDKAVINPGEPGESNKVLDPCVIRDGNKYIMWLVGEENNYKRIFYRESLNY